MSRMACIVVGATAAVSIAAAGSAFSAPRQEHRHSTATAHARSPAAPFSRAPARATVAYPVVYPVVGYAPAYRSSYYSSSRQPLTFARTVTPPVYFVPAISPDAPPFSFSPSEEQPGWNWQRVSLQQIDAEVRARRAAKDAESAPAYRQYCPDSRAYYPDVKECSSEWLTVVAKAPATSATQPVVASR